MDNQLGIPHNETYDIENCNDLGVSGVIVCHRTVTSKVSEHFLSINSVHDSQSTKDYWIQSYGMIPFPQWTAMTNIQLRVNNTLFFNSRGYTK